MIKKLLLMVALVASLFAANNDPLVNITVSPIGEVKIDIDYNYYYNGEITDRDWVGVYKHGASNDWENVLSWTWVQKAVFHGDTVRIRYMNISNLPNGTYDIRYFRNNSFTTYASFTTRQDHEGNNPAHIIVGNLENGYTYSDYITLDTTYEGVDSWVGIYKKGASNAWENVQAWSYVRGRDHEEIKIGDLAPGTYEARLFYNNSYILEAKDEFNIAANELYEPEITRASQLDFGLIYECTTSGKGNKDWVGLFKIGASNAWNNVQAWAWVDTEHNGLKSINIENLESGEYELRLFYHNSYKVEAVKRVSIDFDY